LVSEKILVGGKPWGFKTPKPKAPGDMDLNQFPPPPPSPQNLIP